MKRPGRHLLLAAAFSTVHSIALAHWPGQPEHQFAELGGLKLENGEVINTSGCRTSRTAN